MSKIGRATAEGVQALHGLAMSSRRPLAAACATAVAISAVGCTLVPPKPAACQGEFHPVNAATGMPRPGSDVRSSISLPELAPLCQSKGSHADEG